MAQIGCIKLTKELGASGGLASSWNGCAPYILRMKRACKSILRRVLWLCAGYTVKKSN